MKTLNDFIKNYSSAPELHKKIFKFGGVNWSDFKRYPNDYYAANTGAVTGLIYYADTCKFAQKNIWLILDTLFNYENEVGILNKPSDDVTQFQNWLTWFAWEHMAGELINYLED